MRARVRAAGPLADFITAGQAAAVASSGNPSVAAFVGAGLLADAPAVAPGVEDDAAAALPPRTDDGDAADDEECLTASARAPPSPPSVQDPAMPTVVQYEPASAVPKIPASPGCGAEAPAAAGGPAAW